MCRHLVELGFAPVTELVLANGRRADVAAVSDRGEIVMVEVKSCRADFEADGKWPEYLPYCDRFFFAVAEDFPTEILPGEAGLMVADAFGGAILRQAEADPLPGARRKTILIKLARHAAIRALK